VKFLIDGHNLIGQMRDIHLDDPDDEAQLVDRLHQYALAGRHRITVIFDDGSPGQNPVLSRGPVKAIFALPGSSADQLIIRRLPRIRDRQAWLIVTSDHEILAAASARRLRTERSEIFAARLQSPPTEPAAPDPRQQPPSDDEVEMWLRRFRGR
jgi:predicted RNA-binding protein with PIN domain